MQSHTTIETLKENIETLKEKNSELVTKLINQVGESQKLADENSVLTTTNYYLKKSNQSLMSEKHESQKFLLNQAEIIKNQDIIIKKITSDNKELQILIQRQAEIIQNQKKIISNENELQIFLQRQADIIKSQEKAISDQRTAIKTLTLLAAPTGDTQDMLNQSLLPVENPSEFTREQPVNRNPMDLTSTPKEDSGSWISFFESIKSPETNQQSGTQVANIDLTSPLKDSSGSRLNLFGPQVNQKPEEPASSFDLTSPLKEGSDSWLNLFAKSPQINQTPESLVNLDLGKKRELEDSEINSPQKKQFI